MEEWILEKKSGFHGEGEFDEANMHTVMRSNRDLGDEARRP